MYSSIAIFAVPDKQQTHWEAINYKLYVRTYNYVKFTFSDHPLLVNILNVASNV